MMPFSLQARLVSSPIQGGSIKCSPFYDIKTYDITVENGSIHSIH